MPEWVYLLTCFSYQCAVVVAAILINDLTLIFGIIAGLAESSTVLILPCIFYLIACHRESERHESYQKALLEGLKVYKPRSKKGGGPVVIALVYAYLLLGIGYFLISNYFTFAKIIR